MVSSTRIKKNSMITLSVSEKKEAWKCYNERLLNVGNVWEKRSLLGVNGTEGPATLIDNSMIDKEIKTVKTVKAFAPSGITVKVLKMSGILGYSLPTRIVN